jgi:deazaflavin-dependent oxidoreductase (nitroreductase family)
VIPKAVLVLFWRVVNPLTRPLAGFAPWWVLVETTGRKTGRRRLTPLAAGPRNDTHMLVIAVHGPATAWVLNATAAPEVRLRHKGRWKSAHVDVLPWDPDLARTFNRYARSGPALSAGSPVIVRFNYDLQTAVPS